MTSVAHRIEPVARLMLAVAGARVQPDDAAFLAKLGRAWVVASRAESDSTLGRAMSRGAVYHAARALPRLARGSAEREIAVEVLESASKLHLSELGEIAPEVGYGAFGKAGALGYLDHGYDTIVVDGVSSEQGLSTHPPDDGASRVSYRLAGRFERLRACVALNDSVKQRPPSAVRFVLLGDGREVWRSPPVQEKNRSLDVDASLRGVDHLELIVECPGPNPFAQAVWLDPVVER